MRRYTTIGIVGLALLGSAGCAFLPKALATAAQIGQTIGSALSAAELGASVYYARHPRPDDEARVRAALVSARLALVAYDRAVAAGEGIEAARGAVLAAYDALRALLAGLGVLAARPPDGGAETEAPLPEPFDLPDLDSLMGPE